MNIEAWLAGKQPNPFGKVPRFPNSWAGPHSFCCNVSTAIGIEPYGPIWDQIQDFCKTENPQSHISRKHLDEDPEVTARAPCNVFEPLVRCERVKLVSDSSPCAGFWTSGNPKDCQATTLVFSCRLPRIRKNRNCMGWSQQGLRATYLIPGCVGREVKLGYEGSAGGGAGASVWKSGIQKYDKYRTIKTRIHFARSWLVGQIDTSSCPPCSRHM